jgi:hypothetical protein
LPKEQIASKGYKTKGEFDMLRFDNCDFCKPEDENCDYCEKGPEKPQYEDINDPPTGKPPRLKKYLVVSRSYTGPRKSVEVEAFNKEEAKSKALEYDFITSVVSVTVVKSEPCNCKNTKSKFYQDHGCCEYCFYL